MDELDAVDRDEEIVRKYILEYDPKRISPHTTNTLNALERLVKLAKLGAGI